MLSIAICDDEALHRQNTMNVLLRHAAAYDPVLREFESPATLLAAIEKERYAPEIAFLDIERDRSGTDHQSPLPKLRSDFFDVLFELCHRGIRGEACLLHSEGAAGGAGGRGSGAGAPADAR